MLGVMMVATRLLKDRVGAPGLGSNYYNYKIS